MSVHSSSDVISSGGEFKRIYLSSDSSSSSSSGEIKSEEKSWSVRHPTAAVALKFTGYGLIASLIIGALVGIGASGGFGPGGWLQQTALPDIKNAFINFGDWVKNTAIPAIRKFLDTIPDLNVWQGLAYIAAPILSAAIIAGVSYKSYKHIALHLEHKKLQEAAQKLEAETVEAAREKTTDLGAALEDVKFHF